MTSAQVDYVVENTCLGNCILSQTVCLCLHGPPISLFIDAPQRLFPPPQLSLFRKENMAESRTYHCEQKNHTVLPNNSNY